MRLGKTHARHAVSFKFGDFFDKRKLPTPPAVFGHHALVTDWHMLGNDIYGNCVFAGAAHETMMWSLEGGSPRARFTTVDTLLDYAAVTGFDPKNIKETDNGTDMQVAASYRRKTGIRDALNIRHTIDSYVAMRIGNVDELALATWLLGAVGVGLQLPSTAMDQFVSRQPWSVPSAPQIEGGHYVPCVGRNPAGNFLVISWGRVQQMTPAFYARFSDEAVAYISLEALGEKKISPEGFDAAGLREHLANLSA